MDESGELSEQDVVPNRASLLVFSRKGYIKRMPADLFAAQVTRIFFLSSLAATTLGALRFFIAVHAPKRQPLLRDVLSRTKASNVL